MDKLTKAELFHLVKEAISDKNLIKEMSSYNRVRDHIEGGHPFVIMYCYVEVRLG